MITRSTFVLLRFHFSFFLMPVFLFALSECKEIKPVHAILLFCILHLLVYPSSNGFNSFMDQDEGSIGGLKNPPKADNSMLYMTWGMDVAAVALSFLINSGTSLCIALYIIASRAYSHRGIRLKKYPVAGFLTVFVFQGAFTYFLTTQALDISYLSHFTAANWLPIIASSFLIGGIYPLTQIYQHESDLADGVRTLSYVLGYRGTFLFCAVSFLIATMCLYFHFTNTGFLINFYILQLFLLPVVLFFMYWFYKVYTDVRYANFEYTMVLNVIASVCMNLCFFTLYFLNR